MAGAPTLTNRDLVRKAVDAVNAPLQGFVITEMHIRYGNDWWHDKVVPRKDELKLSYDIPERKGVPDDGLRQYLDVPACLNIMREFKLMDKATHRQTMDSKAFLKSIRNIAFHDGSPEDFTRSRATAAISELIVLAETLGWKECVQELEALRDAVHDPDEAEPVGGMPSPRDPPHAPVREPPAPPAASQAAAREPRREVGQGPAPRPSPGTGQAPTRRWAGPSNDVLRGICVTACEGYDKEIRLYPERGLSRTIVTVNSYDRKDGYYELHLNDRVYLDDSLGLTVDSVDYLPPKVTFSDYSQTARTIRMVPGSELERVMEAGPKSLVLFSDLAWLIHSTQAFMESYGGMIAMPRPPRPYAPTKIVDRMGISDEQREAVTTVMSTPLSYVWGVPGSGKTQAVLATSICECLSRGERVAVIAPTNLALEQVLRGLITAFQKVPALADVIDPKKDILRVGTPTLEFAREFPYVCEVQGIRRKIEDRREKLDFLTLMLKERAYEGIREEMQAVLRRAAEADPDDEAAAREAMSGLAPLLDLMGDDPRYSVLARDMSVYNVLARAEGFDAVVFGPERDRYLDNDFSGIGDDVIREEIAQCERDLEDLMPSSTEVRSENVKVVAMTLSRFIIGYGPMDGETRRALRADHVFVDEAGYCNCIQTASLFTLGVPVTLLGDHKQLPPVCEIDQTDMSSDIASSQMGDERYEGLQYNGLWALSALYVDSLIAGDMSELDLMFKHNLEPSFNHTAVSMLSRTFRFGPNLAEALSTVVYDGKMSSASSEPLKIKVIDAHIDRYPSVDGGFVRKNEAEARAVSDYVRKNGLTAEDTVILCPYKEQISCIRSVDGTLGDMMITIHKSQGREWDNVIISVADGSANTGIEELKPRRFTSTVRNPVGLRVMNTAVSRAKKRLVLVCDVGYWAAQEGELIGEIVRRCDPEDVQR